jgi:hypothetical protein
LQAKSALVGTYLGQNGCDFDVTLNTKEEINQKTETSSKNPHLLQLKGCRTGTQFGSGFSYRFGDQPKGIRDGVSPWQTLCLLCELFGRWTKRKILQE